MAGFEESTEAALRGLQRNAAVMLGAVGTLDDGEVLAFAPDAGEPLVREHAAWALAALRSRTLATKAGE